MSDSSDTHGIVIEWDYPVPRERVFAAWVEPQTVVEWFAPPGFAITKCDLVPTAGEPWQINYEDPNGHTYTERGVRQAADAPAFVSFTHTQVDGSFVGPETLIRVTLEDVDGQTHMRFEQTGFRSLRLAEVSEEGWRECFEKLGETLGVAGVDDWGRP